LHTPPKRCTRLHLGVQQRFVKKRAICPHIFYDGAISRCEIKICYYLTTTCCTRHSTSNEAEGRWFLHAMGRTEWAWGVVACEARPSCDIHAYTLRAMRRQQRNTLPQSGGNAAPGACWGLPIAGTESRNRNVVILGYRSNKRRFFKEPPSETEKKSNSFCGVDI